MWDIYSYLSSCITCMYIPIIHFYYFVRGVSNGLVVVVGFSWKRSSWMVGLSWSRRVSGWLLMVFPCILQIVPCCVLVADREGLIANGIPMYYAVSLYNIMTWTSWKKLKMTTNKNYIMDVLFWFRILWRNQWYEPAIYIF